MSFKIEKSRTLAQMGSIYEVTSEQLKDQINRHKTLKSQLERAACDLEIFYPKHQGIVYRILGDPDGSNVALGFRN